MSTTTNLKLFKHDNPTTNTNQFDIEKAINENLDKIDANAGEVANKIQTLENTTNEKDTSLETEIKALKAENAIFRSQIPSATVVGETVHLEDSSNMPCQIMPLGASIQEATPSIDSEAPIESVGDNIQLFDKNNANLLNGVIDTGTNKINSSANGKCLYLKCNKNKTYTVSKISSQRFVVGTAKDMPKVGTTILNPIVGNTNTSVTITSSLTSEYLVVYYYLNGTDTTTEQEILDSIKICEGTSTGAYSPYGQGSIEIYNCNENFLQNEGVSKTINGVAFTVNKDGTVIANGTATDNVSLYVFAEGSPVKRKPLNIKNGDYILSGCPAGGGSSTYRLGMIYSEGSNNYVYIVDNGSGISFNYDGKNVGVYCEVRKGYTANNLIFKPMIRLATDTDDTFGAHQSQTKALYTQQPLRAIGNVKDRFVKIAGVWYEEYNIGKTILTGTEKFRQGFSDFSTLPNNIISFYVENSNFNATVDYLPCISPNLIGRSQGLWKSSVEGISIGNKTRLYIAINMSTLENFYGETITKDNCVTAITNFIKANNITLYYILETPTLIECTPEQVEVLESFNTYKNVTNISSDSIGEIEVFYYKDLETLIGGA